MTIFDASREDDIFSTASAVEMQSTAEQGKTRFFTDPCRWLADTEVHLSMIM